MLNGTIRKILKESFYRKHRDRIEDVIETFDTITKFILAVLILSFLIQFTR